MGARHGARRCWPGFGIGGPAGATRAHEQSQFVLIVSINVCLSSIVCSFLSQEYANDCDSRRRRTRDNDLLSMRGAQIDCVRLPVGSEIKNEVGKRLYVRFVWLFIKGYCRHAHENRALFLGNKIGTLPVRLTYTVNTNMNCVTKNFLSALPRSKFTHTQ